MSKAESGFGQTFGLEVDPITGVQTGKEPGALKDALNRYQGMNVVRGASTTRAHQAAMLGGTNCVIYNVSPIFQWERRLNNFGVFLIPRAPSVGTMIIDHKTKVQRKATEKDIAGEYRLSEPLAINHSHIRTFASEGALQPYIEFGEDIAEDIVGNS